MNLRVKYTLLTVLYFLTALFAGLAASADNLHGHRPPRYTIPTLQRLLGTNEMLHFARGKPVTIPKQLVVKYRPESTFESRAALHAFTRSQVIHEIPELGIQTVLVSSEQAAAAYKNNPNVLWVEPRYRRFPLLVDPNDPAYNNFDDSLVADPADALYFKWDAHVIDCIDGWGIWPGHYFNSINKGASAVLMAVIDSGIDYGHPDFINAGGSTSNVTGGGQLYRSKDVSIINGVTTPDAWDVYGHGTHVTGIAAAAVNNGVGVTGNAPNAQVISVRVIDENGNGTDTDIAAAIMYAADQGALVANISLGGYGYSQVEQDAVDYAWNKGMLVVAAAGNDGVNTSPNYPGALSRVLAVSATSDQDGLATYSNFGDYIGIAAPGGDIDFNILAIIGVYSTLPTYFVPLNDPNIEGASENFDYLMGTSMSSPQVAGLAALYAGKKGFTQSTANLIKIWQAIQQGADGFGGWDPDYGFGRINVYGTMNLDSVPNPRGDTIGCITGQVLYKGTPVNLAVTKAVPVGGGASVQASTRADGCYRIAGVHAGNYNVTATVFGESQVINTVTVTAGCDIPGVDFNIGTVQGPVAVKSISLSSGTVYGTKSLTGKVTLKAFAPPSGVVVALGSSNPSLAIPTSNSVTVPSGATTATFSITTFGTNTTGVANITATAGTTVSAPLTVRPITVISLSANPNPIVGSKMTTGTVKLEAAAAPGAITVSLSSSNPAIANPSVGSVSVAAGSLTATYTITTHAVTVSTPVVITATAHGVSKTFKLVVNPINVSGLTFSPSSVKGGLTSTAHITLNTPATSNLTITLGSNNPGAAVPAVPSVVILAGSSTGTFTVNTSVVAASTPVLISATVNGITKTATITVKP